ncbi:MAG: hypothetical protein LV481_15470 [Methylacidiphilales bacterium]|nr:hypothetical protein [Candidatus Methylacidiphilales bacterium]
MRFLTVLLSLSAILPLLSPEAKAQAAGFPPPPPSNFDPTALAPKNLPDKLNIPANTRIVVAAWTKGVNPSLPPDTKNMSLLWNPHLLSAVIESDQQNAHAVFQWEGGRSSEAFLIHGQCFRLICLAYPQTVAITSSGLDFWVSRQNPGEGAGGNFPGVSWYSPSAFAGTASLNGSNVLVFAPGPKKPGVTAYPEGASVCIDATTLLPVWLTDGRSIFSFTYSPAPNAQINPQGYYLQVIQKRFGHWP